MPENQEGHFSANESIQRFSWSPAKVDCLKFLTLSRHAKSQRRYQDQQVS